MAQPQKGICAEPNLHALFLMFNVVDDDEQAIRAKLARILDLFSHFDEEHYEAMVSGVIGVGSSYWMDLYPGLIPQELTPFPDMQCEDRSAPVAPCDLFVQIRADRVDICHAIGIEIVTLLGMQVELIEEVQAFRYLDGRDLTGFVDGSENPRGLHKIAIAVVGEDDPDFCGGSYLHIQRYRHNMKKWHLLPVARQEEVMGRTKADNVEFASDDKEAFAHSKRTSIKDSNGDPQEILRQSMPYGDMTVQGLYFMSCAKSPKPFTLMLRSMIFGDVNGIYDKLLDYTTPETGAAFFAPSINFIKQQAEL
ncbi:MAG: putative iron-dependent peroxidase [Paraglaciecola sp.]|jgi:putative iron-dependent peroxidase